MRTFKLTLDVETESPWQHRDVPSRARVIGVFPGYLDAAGTVSVYYETQDREGERFECEAFDVIVEVSGHGLRLGHDPRTDPREVSGNAIDHVGSCQQRDGRVVHVYRRT